MAKKFGLTAKFSLVLITLLLTIFFFQAKILIDKNIGADKEDLIKEMQSYSVLAKEQIITAYELYYNSGYFKFEETTKDLLKLNSDIQKIQIVTVDGRIIFDSDELTSGKYSSGQEERRLTNEATLEKVALLDPFYNETTINKKHVYEVIQPFQNEWGRHDYTIIYLFSFSSLEEQMRQIVMDEIKVSIIFIVISTILLFIFSNMLIITPLKKLTQSVADIMKHNLNYSFNIKLKDEFGDLENAFDKMITDIRKKRQKIEDYSKHLEEKVQDRTRRLKSANDKLRILDKRKDEFISLAAHELKTPLTSIKGFSDLLGDPKISKSPKSRKHYLELIGSNTERLHRLVLDLVDSSRISLGKLQMNIENVSVQEIYDDIKANMMMTIHDKGLKANFCISKNLPKIKADKERVLQVIRNLITNAVKYSEEGTVTISMYKKGGFIQFEVKDTGKGIPKKHQALMFTKFYQVDGAYNKKFGGSGLGLSVCKGIVEFMKGKIWFESKEGKGSTFYFKLPIVRK